MSTQRDQNSNKMSHGDQEQSGSPLERLPERGAEVEQSSGDINQTDTSGTTIAHTGQGDINVRIDSATFRIEQSQLQPLQSQSSPLVSVRRTLPRDVGALIGRTDALRNLLVAVEEGMRTGRPVLIHAIDGMAGVGKTAFAVRAAHQLAGRFPDGQLFVRLNAHASGQRPAEPSDVLGAMLREDGMDPGRIPEGLEERERLWRGRIAGRRILLVLDDAATHEQVEPLIPGSTGCAVLITSRPRLVALEGALPFSLGVLAPDHAASLLALLSGRDDSQSSATAGVVKLAGYLPLAIRLLAGQLRHHPAWTVAHLAEDLGAALDRSVAIGAADKTVSAAFDLSYNRLTEHEQRFFRYLGLHAGPDIDAYAAAALSGLDLDVTFKELDTLFIDNLIEEPIRGRYRFHDLLGDYARGLATANPPEDRDTAACRLLDYYLHTAQAAGRRLARQVVTTQAPVGTVPAHAPDVSTVEKAASWMDAEQLNLSYAVDQAIAHDRPAYATGIPAAMSGYLLTHNHWNEALAFHRAAVSAARSCSDQHAEACALDNLGVIQRLTGDSHGATVSLIRSRDIYRGLDDPIGLAYALTHLGRVQTMMDDYSAAETSLLEALRLQRTSGNQSGEADALANLGLVQRLTTDFAAATASQEGALALYRSLADRRTLTDRNGEAAALMELACMQYMTGNYSQASANLSLALEFYSGLKNRNGQANALRELGVVHGLTGNYAEGIQSEERALELYRSLGSQFGQANALYELGILNRSLGDYPSAATLLTQALELYRDLGDRLCEANALGELGTLQQLTAEYTRAGASLKSALELYSTLGDQVGEAETLNSLGDLSLAMSRPAEAQANYERALVLARSHNAALEEARAQEGLGRCDLHIGQRDKAAPLLQGALEIYRQVGSPKRHQLAEVLRQYNLRD